MNTTYKCRRANTEIEACVGNYIHNKFCDGNTHQRSNFNNSWAKPTQKYGRGWLITRNLLVGARLSPSKLCVYIIFLNVHVEDESLKCTAELTRKQPATMSSVWGQEPLPFCLCDRLHVVPACSLCRSRSWQCWFMFREICADLSNFLKKTSAHINYRQKYVISGNHNGNTHNRHIDLLELAWH